MGKQEESNREHVKISVGNELYGIKWRNYKMMSKEIYKAFADPTGSFGVPLIYDLHDLKEEIALNSQWYHSGWTQCLTGGYIVDHAISLKEEPLIRSGTSNPYEPIK